MQDGLQLNYARSKHLLRIIYILLEINSVSNETSFSVNESFDSGLGLSGNGTSQHSPLNALRIKNPDKLI